MGLRIPGLDPVHKVTIVPRGRALGITASLPEEDRHTYTKEWLEGQLTMLFGGRVAEEMIFGLERITTGAGNDIERATAMARRMVTQFGMSDVIGLMAVGDADHEVFLGREIGHRRMVSEHTARQVDTEVKRILDEAHERARGILEKEEDLMERIAEALLERETLDHDEIQLLADGKPLPPLEKLIIPGAPSNGAPLAEPKSLPAGEDRERIRLLGRRRSHPWPTPWTGEKAPLKPGTPNLQGRATRRRPWKARVELILRIQPIPTVRRSFCWRGSRRIKGPDELFGRPAGDHHGDRDA